jgi:hypothetical protein
MEEWSGIFQPPGVNGSVYATATRGNKLYVGGNFTEAGGVETRDLAVWNRATKQWSAPPLALNAMPSDSITALTVGPDDSLYVGGHFQPRNAAGVNLVAMKNGAVRSVGGGLYRETDDRGSVYALLVFQGDLYAAGDFGRTQGKTLGGGFARWGGTRWDDPGTLWNEEGTLPGATVPEGVGRALALDGQGRVIVGGRFDGVEGSGAAQNIAAFDPGRGTWHVYNQGVSHSQGTLPTFVDARATVHAITFHFNEELQQKLLYIGGDLDQSQNSEDLRNLTFWTGEERGWQDAHGGANGVIYALEGGSRTLRVGGAFTEVDAGALQAQNIAAYTSFGWQSWEGTGRDSDRTTSVRHIRSVGSDTFVGGTFRLAGNPSQPTHRKANHIARWDGGWNALGKGIERASTSRGGVSALAQHGGQVYVGGQFQYAGGVPVHNVARWRRADSTWHALGGGVDDRVAALAVSGSGALFAGGEFRTAESGGATVTARHVALWDGSQWSALASGTDDAVLALATDAGTLYAGGQFSNPGRNVARWDGSSWSSLGSGVGDDVLALAVQGGDLFAGGRFTQAGGQSANHIARWDGTAWSKLESGTVPPGSGLNSTVQSIELSPFGEVLVGGNFTQAGGKTANRVARWYQGVWYPLAGGANDPVETLEYSGECQLYAGGGFTQAGGQDAARVAAWNGAFWSSFTERFDSDFGVPSLGALAVVGDHVFVGGNFQSVTGPDGTKKISNQLAHWGGGFPGANPTATIGFFEPDESTLYYAAPESLRVDLSSASGVGSVDFAFSTDGGSTWETIAQSVAPDGDSASTTWKVPDRTSATKVILRVRSSANPCLSTQKVYDYRHSQNAGKKVTHLTRRAQSGGTEYFYPDRHGYSFENDEDEVWPKTVRPGYGNRSGYFRTITKADSAYFPSWGIFCDSAGDAFCYYPAPLLTGIKWPRQHSALVWRALASGGFRGACAGFATTSMLAFENNQTVLNELGLSAYDDVNTVSAQQGRRPVAKYFTRQLTLSTARTALSQSSLTPTQTLNEVRTMLAQPPGSNRTFRNLSIWTLGKPISQVNFNDPGSLASLEPMGHVVTPYRVVQDPANSDVWYIYVYDNNHAGENQARITVNTATDTWTYPDTFAPGHAYSGSGTHAGFFLVEDVTNYLGVRPPGKQEARPASAASARAPTSAAQAGKALLDTHVRMTHTPGPSVAVRDGADRMIGYKRGVLVNDMLGNAIPLLVRGGRQQPPLGFVVPGDRTYGIEASEFGDAGGFTFSVEEQAATYGVERSAARPGETDRLAYGADGLGIANPDATPKTYRAWVAFPEEARDRSFVLQDVQMAPADSFVTMRRADSTLQVTNTGAATSFDLHLRRVNEESGRAMVDHENVSLPADATLRIVPNWTGLPEAPVVVEVDQGRDGSVDETRTLTGDEAGEETTWFVDASATGGGDGQSWATAFVHLQDALDAVREAPGAPHVVRVAEGVYHPDQDRDGDHAAGDRTESFTIAQDSVEVWGGYPTGGGTRAPRTHRTVLSGDIDGNDATTDGITVRAADIQGANSVHVLTLAGAFSSPSLTHVRVDGVVVTGGQATGESSDDKAGGGVLVDRGSPRVVRTVIQGNRAETRGGGMLNEGNLSVASPALTNVTFVGNRADSGGGLYNSGNAGQSSPALTNVLFVGNRATAGGAVYNDAVNGGVASPTIVNATFANNATDAASSRGGGGALFNNANAGGSSAPEVVNSILWGNQASGRGVGPQIKNQAAGAQPTVHHSILEGGLAAVADNAGAATTGGDQVLDQDPKFADLEGADYLVGGWTDARLQGPGAGDGPSPAIDAGDNTALPADSADLDGDGDTGEPLPMDRLGRARVQTVRNGATVDMGMFESAGQPLPVELAAWQAAQVGAEAVRLKWTTATEENNAAFHILHSAESEGDWTRVGTVPSKASGGTTQNPTTYRYRVKNLGVGTHRFRLRQVDLDGSATRSDPVTATVQMREPVRLTAPAPNPVSAEADLSFAVKQDVHVTIALFNVLGQRVRTLYAGTPPAGESQSLRIDASRLPSGAYFLRLKAGGDVKTRQMTVVQ